ncbi:pilin [Pseudomonas sp. D1-3]
MAGAAKTAVSDTFASRSVGAVAAYEGTGVPAASSYGYEFAATTNVASIAIGPIANVATPVRGEGAITITYANQVGTAMTGETLVLTPGSGLVPETGADAGRPAGAMSTGLPVVWGCATTGGNTQVFKYVPATCRY